MAHGKSSSIWATPVQRQSSGEWISLDAALGIVSVIGILQQLRNS